MFGKVLWGRAADIFMARATDRRSAALAWGATEPLRILMAGDYPGAPTFGSSKVYFKLREEFEALGHSVRVIFTEELGVRPSHRLLRAPVAPWLAFRCVRHVVQKEGPFDVLDIASAEALWTACFRRASGVLRSAVINRSHGLEHLNYRRMVDDHHAGIASKPWHRRLFYPAVRLTQVAAAARCSDRLIVLNGADREFALRSGWLTEDSIWSVPHGVSDRYLSGASVTVGPRGRGILFCGTWTAVKGIDYLVRGYERYASLGGSMELSVLGGNVPTDWIKNAFEPATRQRLRVVERSPEDVVINHYRSHDTLVFPSTYEGFGMVLAEAMSQGIAVIATPVGAGAELVEHEVTGLRIPPRDPEAIAQALLRLEKDCELRLRLGENARRRVAGMSWRRTAERTVECYRSALCQRRSGLSPKD